MKVLLVASSGGHLQQLVWLRPWWSSHERAWVTFDTVDAAGMLAGEEVFHAWFPTNRSLQNLVRNTILARRVLSEVRPDVVVSTGAAVAVPFFSLAAAYRARTVFVEPYDRIDGPSLTGRLVSPLTDLIVVQRREQLAFHPRGVWLGAVR